jgi:hypothetical protein
MDDPEEESVINFAIVIPENHTTSSNITPSDMPSNIMQKEEARAKKITRRIGHISSKSRTDQTDTSNGTSPFVLGFFARYGLPIPQICFNSLFSEWSF